MWTDHNGVQPAAQTGGEDVWQKNNCLLNQ